MKGDRDIKNIYCILATVVYVISSLYFALQCAFYGLFSSLFVRPEAGFLKRLYYTVFPRDEELYVAVALTMFFFAFAYVVLVAMYRKRKSVYIFAATIVPFVTCAVTIGDYNGAAKDYGALPSVLFFVFAMSIAYAIWLCVRRNSYKSY